MTVLKHLKDYYTILGFYHMVIFYGVLDSIRLAGIFFPIYFLKVIPKYLKLGMYLEGFSIKGKTALRFIQLHNLTQLNGRPVPGSFSVHYSLKDLITLQGFK